MTVSFSGTPLTNTPPQISKTDVGLRFIEQPSDVTVLRGASAIIDCSVDGDSEAGPVNISWRRNGEPLVTDRRRYVMTNGSLFFRRIKGERYRADVGVYECIAGNQIGTIMSQRAQLQIAGE